METDIYAIAFAEVYEIFKIMDEKDLQKIPKQFKEFIEKNKSNKYIPKIDRTIPLYKQELKKETFAICSLIYRNYLISSEKRKELTEKDKEELALLEKELREKYNPEDIFQNTEADNNIHKAKEILSKKENIIIKILKKIFKNNTH